MQCCNKHEQFNIADIEHFKVYFCVRHCYIVRKYVILLYRLAFVFLSLCICIFVPSYLSTTSFIILVCYCCCFM